MKVVGVVGYKKSGKTTLILKIVKQLISRGYQVAIIKHISGDINYAYADSSRFKNVAPQVVAVNPEETIIYLKDAKSIEQIIQFIKADIILVEGFKNEKTFPKIVCLRDSKEKEELCDGLELCTASLLSETNNNMISDYSILRNTDIKEMTQIIINNAFKLPNLNCGACGLTDCYGLAKSIVRGDRAIDDCIALNSDVEISVEGNKIPMNPFTSKMVKNAIYGLLSPLKGFKSGNINIALKEK
jgi:molybdopterin-guanine dinucleotide biosynthesis protein B